MPKTIYITEINEIKGIKIICSCGAQWFIPLDSKGCPLNCFSCQKQLPYHDIDRFLKAFNSMIQVSKDTNLKIIFETE
jgi:hypothetical protein